VDHLRAEVTVVGAGVHGLAAARALARAGRDVVVLERFHVGHPHGSSHGSSRIFRLVYDDPTWARLAQEALPLWRALERETGGVLLEITGMLEVGRDLEPVRRALEECDAGYELLAPAEVERRFGLVVDETALFDGAGGVFRADRALGALRRSAEAAGARVLEGTRALTLEPVGGGVRLETAGAVVEAVVAVIAAGSWAGPLLATAGVPLPVSVTRETVAYVKPLGPHRPPSVLDWRPGDRQAVLERPGALAYGLWGGEGRLKIGLHHAGVPADPDVPGEPDPEIVRAAAAWAAQVYPGTSSEPIGAETCLYTTTADESFVLERHGPIVVGSACSGHGFKFAPLVGERLAALALDALAER
jgi:sarcosine oxidase